MSRDTVVEVDALPAYSELPAIAALGIRTTWGLLPKELGTLAFLTSDVVKAAGRSVETGERIQLDVVSNEFDPPLFDRTKLENNFHATSRNIFEDEFSHFNPQSSSQWDGLLHIRAREYGFYTGITDVEEAQESLGIHHWAKQGIVGRGVLLDVPRSRQRRGKEWDPFAGDVVEPEELKLILEEQGETLRRGDILCVRTGWLAAYRARVAAGQDVTNAGDRFSGVSSSDALVEFLWENRVAAISSDNPAVESAPGDPSVGSLHRKLIPGIGMPFGELFDLDQLATRLNDLGRSSFLLAAAPLAVHGAASSTANAVAIL